MVGDSIEFNPVTVMHDRKKREAPHQYLNEMIKKGFRLNNLENELLANFLSLDPTSSKKPNQLQA